MPWSYPVEAAARIRAAPDLVPAQMYVHVHRDGGSDLSEPPQQLNSGFLLS
jgi:hypothetical protein